MSFGRRTLLAHVLCSCLYRELRKGRIRVPWIFVVSSSHITATKEQVLSGLCWSRLAPAQRSWFHTSLPNAVASDVGLVDWNRSCWEYLHNRNWQTQQIHHYFRPGDGIQTPHWHTSCIFVVWMKTHSFYFNRWRRGFLWGAVWRNDFSQGEEGTVSDSPGGDHSCRELRPHQAQTRRTPLAWHLARLGSTSVSPLLKQLHGYLRTALHAKQALVPHVDLEWSWKVHDSSFSRSCINWQWFTPILFSKQVLDWLRLN